MWKSIETAPKNEYILIRVKEFYIPDIAIWKDKTRDKMIEGNLWLGRPEGWFRVDGGRSHIINPKEYIEIPD